MVRWSSHCETNSCHSQWREFELPDPDRGIFWRRSRCRALLGYHVAARRSQLRSVPYRKNEWKLAERTVATALLGLPRFRCRTSAHEDSDVRPDACRSLERRRRRILPDVPLRCLAYRFIGRWNTHQRPMNLGPRSCTFEARDDIVANHGITFQEFVR